MLVHDRALFFCLQYVGEDGRYVQLEERKGECDERMEDSRVTGVDGLYRYLAMAGWGRGRVCPWYVCC